jgi:integrase
MAKDRHRGHGEGTITQRKDGRWEARISLPGGRRKTLYGKTRGAVRDKLTAALRDVQQGLPLVGERQPVADFLEQWLEHTARHRLRPRTFYRYQQLVRVHAVPRIGKIALARLTPQDLSALYAARLAAGSSPRTVQFLHAVLHRALKQALQWNLIARNPADAVQAPRPRRPEIHPLTQEQTNALLDAGHGDDLEALYVLAVMTGMRQGELLGLRWPDLDWDSGRLEVRHTLQWDGRAWYLAEPKTGRSRRSIKLPPTVLQALRGHRARQHTQRLGLGPAWQDHGFVFCQADGTPLPARNLGRLFAKLLQRAGLPRVRFHDLRHTAGTSLIAEGIPLVMVKDLLGHSTIAITADIYSHVLPPHQDQIAERMEQLYGRATGT